jgi:hypothetical protein
VPLQAKDIVSYACQIAKAPLFTTQAGDFLNRILAELCSYDLDVIRTVTNFTFNSGAGNNQGPYTLPTNWLRSNRGDVLYTILGVPYVMIPITLAEFDSLVEQAGLSGYPTNYAVDTSPIATQSAPQMFVWPPPSGSYPVTARYFAQQADISTPASSSTVPWFPNQEYLLRRLTGEVMLLTGDDRATQFLGGLNPSDGFMGAAEILDRYLKMQGESDSVKRVSLDRRIFGPSWNNLPDTKTIGW